jgi:hypothetical protein
MEDIIVLHFRPAPLNCLVQLVRIVRKDLSMELPSSAPLERIARQIRLRIIRFARLVRTALPLDSPHPLRLALSVITVLRVPVQLRKQHALLVTTALLDLPPVLLKRARLACIVRRH